MAPAKIHYLCPDIAAPMGGVRVIYRHVDLLNAAGMDAAVLHEKKGFRAGWFSNKTRIEVMAEARFSDEDILVIPDVLADEAARILPGLRKVVLVQHHAAIFNRTELPGKRSLKPGYLCADVVHALAVSRHIEDFLRFSFPGLPVTRVHLSVDPATFYPSKRPKKQIAFMPRKMSHEAVQVIGMLESRRALAGFSVRAISGEDEASTARALRESAIFLNVSASEGFGLPAAEAMASGCVVVGYDGFGGREYFRPSLCFPVESGNTLALAKALEKVVRGFDGERGPLRAMSRRAGAFIRRAYDPAREASEVTRFWRSMLSAP